MAIADLAPNILILTFLTYLLSYAVCNDQSLIYETNMKYEEQMYKNLDDRNSTELLKEGSQWKFSCVYDVSTCDPATSIKLESLDPTYHSHCLPSIAHLHDGTDELHTQAILLHTGSEASSTIEKSQELRSRSARADVTSSWQGTHVTLTYSSSNVKCHDSGQYVCNDGDRGTPQPLANANVDVILKEELHVNQNVNQSELHSLVQGVPKTLALRQGFSQMLTCRVYTTSYTLDWRWEVKCHGGSSFTKFTEKEGLDVSYQGRRDYEEDGCYLSTSDTTSVFLMTSQLDGCTLRCSVIDGRNDTNILRQYDVTVSITQDSLTSEPLCDPIVHVVTFILGVVVAAVCWGVVYARYKQKHGFQKKNWRLFKVGRNK